MPRGVSISNRNRGRRIHWNMIISFIVFMVNYAKSQAEFNNDRLEMSKKNAAKKCGSRLLASSTEIQISSAQVYLDGIDEGESAWISGNVEFSPFMAWRGCWKLSRGVEAAGILNPTVYTCSKHCIKQPTAAAYIALSISVCYCVDEITDITDPLPAHYCAVKCGHSFLDRCGNNANTINIYSIYQPRNADFWGNGEPARRQCLYVKWKTDYFRAYTASCHTVNALTTKYPGHICNCTNKVNSICVFDDATTWARSRSDCGNFSGLLAPVEMLQHVTSGLKTNHNYWINMFRTFVIIDTYPVHIETSACLAVTRVADKLFLDPDDCNSQKKYLCKANISDEERVAEKLFLDPDECNSQTKYLCKANISDEERVSTERIATSTTFTTLALCAGFVGVLTVSVVSVIIIKRRRQRPTKLTELIDDTQFIELPCDDDIPTNGNVVTNSHGSGRSTIKVVHAPNRTPSKPVRHALTQKGRHCQSVYENVNLRNKPRPETDDGKGVCVNETVEYDVLNLTVPNTVSIHKDTDCEPHVYNHTLLREREDNYDTMKSTKSTKSSNLALRMAAAYSHMSPQIKPIDVNSTAEKTIPTAIYSCCVIANEDEQDINRIGIQANSHLADPLFIIEDDVFYTTNEGTDGADLTDTGSDSDIIYTDIHHTDNGYEKAGVHQNIVHGASNITDDVERLEQSNEKKTRSDSGYEQCDISNSMAPPSYCEATSPDVENDT